MFVFYHIRLVQWGLRLTSSFFLLSRTSNFCSNRTCTHFKNEKKKRWCFPTVWVFQFLHGYASNEFSSSKGVPGEGHQERVFLCHIPSPFENEHVVTRRRFVWRGQCPPLFSRISARNISQIGARFCCVILTSHTEQIVTSNATGIKKNAWWRERERSFLIQFGGRQTDGGQCQDPKETPMLWIGF